MILGLDWVASFSPMQVHWAQKLCDHGSTALLVGDTPSLPMGSVVQLCLVQEES